MFGLFKKDVIETMLLKSLNEDQWLITQGSGSCASHFYLHRNGIELNLSLSEEWGWMLFSAKVNGQELKKYRSVKNKCVSLVQKKIGDIDIEEMVKRELDFNDTDTK